MKDTATDQITQDEFERMMKTLPAVKSLPSVQDAVTQRDMGLITVDEFRNQVVAACLEHFGNDMTIAAINDRKWIFIHKSKGHSMTIIAENANEALETFIEVKNDAFSLSDWTLDLG
jgi:hypothetical protein